LGLRWQCLADQVRGTFLNFCKIFTNGVILSIYRGKSYDLCFKNALFSATPDASYEACLETTKQYVTNLTEIKRVPELTQDDQQLYLFGYYYDRGVQANVVEYTLEQVGGEAKVADFRSAAERGLFN
jgi:hypothetical protein